VNSLIFGLVVLVVLGVGVPVIGFLFSRAVRRWIPLRAGEVRPNLGLLGCGVLCVFAGVTFGGLAASSLGVNPTAPVGVLLGMAFLLFAAPLIWWWSTWRLRSEGEQLHFRPAIGRSRSVAWADLQGIEGQYGRGRILLRFGDAPPIAIPIYCEGTGVLLDAAWKRSVPFKGFEPFLKTGMIMLPKEA
jgi:hypothetical protein